MLHTRENMHHCAVFTLIHELFPHEKPACYLESIFSFLKKRWIYYVNNNHIFLAW